MILKSSASPISTCAAITCAWLMMFTANSDHVAGAGEELHWYRCNTHTHTRGADVNATPEFVAEWYRAHGYQCIVITDHEYLTDVTPLNRKYGADGRFLVLPGQEVTQVVSDARQPNGLRHAHVNGIDTNRVIEPLRSTTDANATGLARVTVDGMSVAQTFTRNLAEITRAGGIFQVNHPNLQWSVGLEDLQDLDTPFLLEIWNAFPTSNNLGGHDKNQKHLSTEALWDALLSRGRRVWGVASDDAHEYQRFDDREAPTPGKAWIVIQARALTPQALTEALRAGQFYASTGVSLETYSADRTGIAITIAENHEWSPALKPTARYLTRFIGQNGQVLSEVTGRTPSYRFTGEEAYVRASIIDSDGRRAWTQPLFVDRRATAAR